MEQTSLCDKCGIAWPTKQLIVSVKNGESFNLFCPKCAMFFGQCPMCEYYEQCGFENDPDPSPKFRMIAKQTQTSNGYYIERRQVPNTERLRKFCLDGKCMCCNEDDPKDPFCCRHTGYATCGNFKETYFESKNK